MFFYEREKKMYVFFVIFCFQETLSKSCMIPGIAVKREQRSYSSLSRSQPRTAGMFGSRTVGTGGTGVVHESSDCSGVSTKDECYQNKSHPELENFLPPPGRMQNGNDLLTRDSTTSDLQQNAATTPKDNNTQCLNGKALSQSNDSRKKWWQFIKWIPGLKSMTLENRFMYTIPIRKEAKSLSNNREEYSMTVTNFNSSSLSAVDSRPV